MGKNEGDVISLMVKKKPWCIGTHIFFKKISVVLFRVIHLYNFVRGISQCQEEGWCHWCLLVGGTLVSPVFGTMVELIVTGTSRLESPRRPRCASFWNIITKRHGSRWLTLNTPPFLMETQQTHTKAHTLHKVVIKTWTEPKITPKDTTAFFFVQGELTNKHKQPKPKSDLTAQVKPVGVKNVS